MKMWCLVLAILYIYIYHKFYIQYIGGIRFKTVQNEFKVNLDFNIYIYMLYYLFAFLGAMSASSVPQN